MAITPMIPRRFFIPLTLFNFAAALALLPLAVFFPLAKIALFGWLISCLQLIFALFILCRLQGALKLRWPLVPLDRLTGPSLSLKYSLRFAAANLLGLLPALLVYLFLVLTLAVDHFSDGFLALHPGRITVQVKTYARADGKTIELIPMSHVADAEFYKTISQSFPPDSIVLMEGVSDDKKLLTNGIHYKEVAASMGLAEQKTDFVPRAGEIINADVDVDQFSPVTIQLLNLVMNDPAKGINSPEGAKFIQSLDVPQVMQMLDDVLTQRNQHLLGEITAHLAQPGKIMVPWGAMHMPGIAAGIEKDGFHLVQTTQVTVIRFRRL
jgi:hypothetical protein